MKKLLTLAFALVALPALMALVLVPEASAQTGKATICVLKFEDKNGNGVRDTGELSLPGWTFQIKDGSGHVAAIINTGGPNKPCATVPAPGTYTVAEQSLPGWTTTTPNPQTVTVSPGQSVNLIFGNQRAGKCDLTIGKSLAHMSIHPPFHTGQQVTFEIVVTNQGTGTCLAPTSVTDIFSGLTYVSGGTSGWSATGGPNSPVAFTNAGLSLGPGQSSLLLATFTVTAPPGTSIKNCATVKNKNDSNLSNNEACIKEPVAPEKPCDLAITKTISPNPLVSGQPATVTITVKNMGTQPCPPGAFPGTGLHDPKPTGLTFTAAPVANQPGWSCGLAVPTGDADCANQSPLPPGYSVTFTIKATVTALPGSSITNCATVANGNDANPANNKSCVTVKVNKK